MAGHRFIEVSARLCATRVVALLLMCSARLLAAPAGDWPSGDEARRIVESMEAIFPDCKITQTTRNTVPNRWHTEQPAAFLMLVKPPEEWWRPDWHGTAFSLPTRPFAIWFLPRDWVGVMLPEADGSYPYQEVWAARGYKAVVVGAPGYISFLLERQLRLRKADLDGSAGDWWSAAALFAGRLEQAVETGRRLMAQVCRDDGTRIIAAESLCRIGVPATDILSEIARKDQGATGERAISALCRVGSRAAIATLCEMVRDPMVFDDRRAGIARGLLDRADASCGPALAEGLAVAKSDLQPLVEVLGKLRYRPAAPRILELLRTTQDRVCRNECARALAGMRYAPAVPILRAILALPPADRKSFRDWEDRRVSDALIQLTGSWGKAGGGVRLLIEPPQRVVFAATEENRLIKALCSLFGIGAPTQADEPFRVRVYIENVSDKKLLAAEACFVINGRRGKGHRLLGAETVNDSLGINEVLDFTATLPEAVQSGGWQRIAYETQGTVSNEITIFVWTPSLVLMAGWAVSVSALGAALAGMAGACRMGRWRLGLGGWKREAVVTMAVSLIQVMVLVARVFEAPGMGWWQHALAFAVVVVVYKVTHRKAMRWRALALLGLVQQAVAIGLALLVCVP